MKKVFIASDHAGFSLKKHLLENFTEEDGVEWHDLGPSSEDRVDYPDFADLVSRQISSSREESCESIGVLVCGSGQGMAIRANKHSHIRAALCWNEEVAQLSREHNDANVLCMGSRLVEWKECENILRRFLSTEFAGGRHQGRVDKVHASTT